MMDAAKPLERRPRALLLLLLLLACLVLLALAVAAIVAVRQASRVDPVLELHGQDGHAEHVAFTPRSDHVVAQFEHTVSVWTVPAGERVGHFWVRERGAPSETFALAPDGRRLAIGRTLRAIPGGEVVGQLPIPCLAWSPDGALVAGVASGTFVVAHASGEWTRALQASASNDEESTATAAFSPDGALLATSSQGGVRLFDMATGGLLVTHRLALARGAPRPAFGDGGRTALFFGEAGLCTIPVDGSGPPTAAPEMPVTTLGLAYVAAGAASRDGALIATGSLHGDVRLWTRLGARVDSFRSGGLRVQALAFSADSRWLASGHLENVVRVWPLRP